MYRHIPNTRTAVNRALTVCREMYKATTVPADRAISADQWHELDESNPTGILNRMIKETTDVRNAQSAQAPLIELLGQLANRLAMICSHFHQVLDLAIARGKLTPAARTHYGRYITDTNVPKLASHQDIDEVAANIIKGEADRQTAEGAGYVAMAMPSAAEVNAQYGPFHTTFMQAQSSKATTDTQREEVGGLYPAAHDLVVDIYDTVEFFYRKDPDAGSRRAKCERWGVVYLSEEKPPPPPATPH
jgi:hypothetical protein